MPFQDAFAYKFTKLTVQVDNFTITLPNSIKFLTHYHSDHYQGIKQSDHVYCSQITANMLTQINKCHPIPIQLPIDVNGILVTPISANHCPGSLMFLFEELSSKSTVLFTGDFKYDISKQICIQWGALQSVVDTLVLDTTYIDHVLIPQKFAVLQCVNYLKANFEFVNDKIVFCSYILGKERILKQICEALSIKFYAMSKKRNQSLRVVFGSKFEQHFTEKDDGQGVIINGNNERQKLKICAEYSRFRRVFLVEATGWLKGFSAYQDRQFSQIVRVKVPYSEHSDRSELCSFVEMVQPKKIVSILAKDAEDNDKIVKKLVQKKPVVKNTLDLFISSM